MVKLLFTKRNQFFFFGMVILFNVSCSAGNQITPDSPAETKRWLGKGGGFYEWGPAVNGIWGTSLNPEVLEVWQWDKNTLMKQHEIAFERSSLHVAWLADDKYVVCMEDDSKDVYSKWSYLLIDAKTKKQLHSWGDPNGWEYIKTGASTNGKYLAVLAQESPDNPDRAHRTARCRLDIVDVQTGKLTDTAILSARTSGSPGRPIAANDGKYIGVPGWANGMTVIDVETRKSLWSKKPPESISLTQGVFSPDGKSVYVGGGCGHMYQMDTMTGEVLSKWFATDTQQGINGHHVTCVAVSPDGQYVAAGTGSFGEIYVWSKQTKKIRKITVGDGTTYVVSFSPDSKNLASFSPGTIKIWPRSNWESKQIPVELKVPERTKGVE